MHFTETQQKYLFTLVKIEYNMILGIQYLIVLDMLHKNLSSNLNSNMESEDISTNFKLYLIN